MSTSSKPRFGLRGLVALYAITAMSASLHASVTWGKALAQAESWYSGDEAATLADMVVAYQHPSGGWQKNTDMSIQPGEPSGHEKDSSSAHSPTIDNGATTTQLTFLARMISQRPEKRWVDSFNRGVDYLLAAQYPNGGWPQFFPLRKGYYSHITYNDNAMVNVLTVLRDLAQGRAPYAFVDQERRTKGAAAVAKGVECILRTQIVIDGKKTAWCAQHDENTLQPAWARKFEPPCLTGKESFKIIEFLMEIEKPTPEIIAAITAGMAWVEKSKLTGLRVEKVPSETVKGGFDKVVIEDASATEPLWARFYEIPSNRPIFMGRDSVIHYKLSDIEPERRLGYGWYGTDARSLLEKKYPKWKKLHGL